jgi:hypothetical protein
MDFINIHKVHAILSNNELIKDLEFERMLDQQGPVCIYDYHDIFLAIFSLLLICLETMIKILCVLAFITFGVWFVYECINWFSNRNYNK